MYVDTNDTNFFILFFVNTVFFLRLETRSNIISIVFVSETEVNNDLTSNDTIAKSKYIRSFFIFPIKLEVLLMV